MHTGFSPVELQDQNNGVGVCFQTWGAKETFKRGKDSTDPILRHPRWFKFGTASIHELGVQMDIVNELTGKRVPSFLNDDDPNHPGVRCEASEEQFHQVLQRDREGVHSLS